MCHLELRYKVYSTGLFQLVSLHLLSIQFVFVIFLVWFMMMLKRKKIDDWHCWWQVFFRPALKHFFLSQSEICATKHHKIFCTVWVTLYNVRYCHGDHLDLAIYRVGIKEWPPYCLKIRAFFEFFLHFLSVELSYIKFLLSNLD